MQESFKEIEQRRRSSFNTVPSHSCNLIHNDSLIPGNWSNILNCRKCKRLLTQYLAKALLKLVPPFLYAEQEFLTNIGVHVYSDDKSGLQEYCLSMYTNAKSGYTAYTHPAQENLSFHLTQMSTPLD